MDTELIGQDKSVDAKLHRDKIDLYVKAIEKYSGNITMAARALGIPRTTLSYRLKQMQIDCRSFKN